MDNETEKILAEQMAKLPKEVVASLSSRNWAGDLNEIGSLYNLSPEELYGFKREITLVLMGLVHPDTLSETLSQEVGLRGAILDALVANIENKIFAPIRPALLEFFESESTQSDTEKVPLVPPVLKVPPVPRAPDIAPDNLPTGEVAEPLLPPIPTKPSPLDVVHPGNETPLNWDITPTHTFEEKMKKVFTTGQQSMGDLTLEPVAPQVPVTTVETPVPNVLPVPLVPPVPPVPNVPPTPRAYRADPYREAVE